MKFPTCPFSSIFGDSLEKEMKKTKLFYGDTRLKDIYVGATKWEVFKYRTARFIRKVIIVSFIAGIAVGSFKIGTLTTNPHTVYAEKEVIKEVEKEAPILKRIAQCESGGSHYKNGQVIINGKNKNGSVDLGKYQINSTWNATATKMGLDLTNEQDNEAFAKWLYANKGTEPWYSSKPCWNK